MNATMTWEEICADPLLRDLPYKIEQDRYGRIVMSPPPSPDHGEYQAAIAVKLAAALDKFAILTECPVDTTEGVKVPDVAAMPRERRGPYRGKVVSLPEAPEICVEVLSPRNSAEEIDEKRRLYAAKGCREFWTCSLDGEMKFFDACSGEPRARSALCPNFPPRIELG